MLCSKTGELPTSCAIVRPFRRLLQKACGPIVLAGSSSDISVLGAFGDWPRTFTALLSLSRGTLHCGNSVAIGPNLPRDPRALPTPNFSAAFLYAPKGYTQSLHHHLVPFHSCPLPRLVPQISSHLLMSCNEKLPLPLMFPHQDANLLRIPTRRLKLHLRIEILEQIPHRRFHPIPFQLP